MPEKFDENEWFIVISTLIALIIVKILPKRFPIIITILLCLFISAVSKIVDHLLSGSTLVNLYDFNDSTKYEYFDLFLQWILYPIIGYLFVYWYDYWKEKRRNTLLLIVVIIVISTIYEAISVKFKVFDFREWYSYLSAAFYSFAFPITIFYYHVLKKWYEKINRI
ncbi:MAG: hypothetical protein ABF649_00135 [Bacillus sp. (in: firmicutes)]